MAQLRDTIVSGSLRATDSLLTTTLQTKILNVPTSNGGTTYGSGTSGHILFSGGSTNGAYWGATTEITSLGIITSGTWNGTTIGVGYGGTGTNTAPTANGVIYASSASAYASTAAGTDGYILIGKGSSAAPAWQEILPTSHGGTGTKTAPTQYGVIYASTASAYASTAAGTDGYVLSGKGSAAPAWTNKGNGRIFYGTCASAANAAQKVVVCSQYDTLTVGDIMIVTFTNTNTTNTALTMVIQNAASSPTVTTTAKDIKCQIVASISNIPAVGYLVAARPYEFVYDGTYWMLMNINRDNNDNTYDRTLSSSGTKTAETAANGGVGLHRYSLELLTVNNTWSSISTQAPAANTANDETSAKTAASCAFLLNGPMFWQDNDTGAAPGGSCSPNGYTTVPCNFKRGAATTTGWTDLTISLPVYLIGQVQADKKSFKLKAISGQPWWTQTLPTTNDGYIYIYLGVAYNATNIYLHTWHPIYWHDGYNLQLYQGEASYGAVLPETGREGQVFYQLSDPWYEIPSGGNAGDVLMKHSTIDRDVYWNTPSGGFRPDTTVKYYVAGSTASIANTNPGVFNTNVYVENSVLFGAAWNDYAEYRQCLLPQEPGRCIVENGDGTLSLSTKRLQPGAEIVSDTFGFAIGQNKKSNTPIAVSGRVLAYMDVPRSQVKIGAPVCSGPNGTVSQMTEQEARDYPWLIIGTVSQIPVEAEWGEKKVKVNGRVWIRVR